MFMFYAVDFENDCIACQWNEHVKYTSNLIRTCVSQCFVWMSSTC